ncbi:MAG: hypothetical protein ACOY4K_15595 [Pseudomonadota bacterium]
MNKTTIAAALAAACGLMLPASSLAQSGYSSWYYHGESDGVEVYYAVKVNSDELRVAWKCVNTTGEAKACSIGAGDSKYYFCRRNGVGVGTTSSPGERALVRPGGEYVFPSDFACRGTGATEVQPSARISIES